MVTAPKTRRRRSVRLLGPLASDLREWRLASRRPGEDAPVFPAEEAIRRARRGESVPPGYLRGEAP